MAAIPSLDTLLNGIKAGDRLMLSKAITLVESTLEEHRKLAHELIEVCLPLSGNSKRIGVTGIPGAGKSTLLNTLGMHIADESCRVAVLTIDPSSRKTGGSILGDKTRMSDLAVSPHAYIRPSPDAGQSGGVGTGTREAIILCEAAGFDVVFVETVGTGQSEYQVQEMVDFLILITLAGGGDGLQGIKRGVLEWADLIVVNKADGSNHTTSLLHRKELEQAIHLIPPGRHYWTTPVLAASSTESEGIEEIWSSIQSFFEEAGQELEQDRAEQALKWMHHLIRKSLLDDFFSQSGLDERLAKIEADVRAGQLTPFAGTRLLLKKER